MTNSASQQIYTVYNGITYKHILLPVWLNGYQYMDKTYTFEVNGQTGVATGTRPYSFWKIFGFVAMILAIIGAIALIVSMVKH